MPKTNTEITVIFTLEQFYSVMFRRSASKLGRRMGTITDPYKLQSVDLLVKIPDGSLELWPQGGAQIV